MFEKSLVDLIRGLRNHRGHETEYIQNALKECRSEIRSQDMDVKATALLKLVYLEMFGYDMAWAAFNVLEVMSSPKQMQKRVGYLAAVQTFRPETDVLMLAENLLKKDLTSPAIPTLCLPLVTIPHIVTSSLALSILTEVLPRLSHSQPSVRKKTIVSLYRLALVYPDTLKVAWPKVKERLMDTQESSSVTAAAVNVVCELGWRRPQDFLALAPRLFELLTSNKNNWMAIKIIKLFAVLTPLEPRLIKKLARPLAKILRETGAMSLLYECISGIIQGGILDGGDVGVDVEEVADLCISKLRGMIVLEGDPNLKYVALLAFNKIVDSHPKMVSMQQDVILKCLDDLDISVKMQALELVSGMVDADSLQSVVNRLMKQLANAPKPPANGETNGHVEEENTDLEQRLIPDKRGSEILAIPDEYRDEIISRILDMCSANTYSNITDFEWYIDILAHLVRHLPADKTENSDRTSQVPTKTRLDSRIGNQILDIAVRVKELRTEATLAAEKLVLISNRSIIYASHSAGLPVILNSASWLCGEYSAHLASPYDVLNSLIHDSTLTLPAFTLSTITQAIPKILSRIITLQNTSFSPATSTTLSFLLARTTTFYSSLSMHSALEVQERAVSFLELLKLCSDALSTSTTTIPILLSTILPSLFAGTDLNPVSASAQSKIPVPANLDLSTPINANLNAILADSQLIAISPVRDAYDAFYHDREPEAMISLQPHNNTGTNTIPRPPTPEDPSYQTPDSPITLARRKAARAALTRDDPFYIAPSGSSSPIHNILRSSNGGPEDLDIDSIPIIDLQLDTPSSSSPMLEELAKRKKKTTRKFFIADDETIDVPSQPSSQPTSTSGTPRRTLSPARNAQQRPSRNLLSIPSSQLSALSLSDDTQPMTAADLQRHLEEEREMAAALAEVERKRLEMQRDVERQGTQMAEGVDTEGAVVKRKKKKKAMVSVEGGVDEEGGVVKKKKKKTKQAEANTEEIGDGGDEELVVKKKKKKRKVGAPREDV